MKVKLTNAIRGSYWFILPVKTRKNRKCQFEIQPEIPSSIEGKFKNVNDEKEKFSLLDAQFTGRDAGKESPRKRPWFREAAPQVLASLGFGFMVASVAAICIMPTLVIPDLYRNATDVTGTSNSTGQLPNLRDNSTENQLFLTKAQTSWYGSLSYLVQPIASICSGFAQNTFGRRRMMLAATIPLFLSWIFLHFANDVPSLYVTQIIFGLSIGFMEAPSMSYLGEAMQPKYRGTLSSLSEFLYIAGTLYLYTSGVYFTWRTVCIFGAVLPCITFAILCMLPESPTWFIVKGRMSEAEDALKWLRGWVTGVEVQGELQMLAKAISDNPYSGARIIEGEFTKVKNTPSQLALFKQPRVWKPVLLICIFFFAGNAGSLIGMRPTFVSIFEQLELPIPARLVLVTSSILNGVGCILCVTTVHKMGKRFISISSLSLCAVSSFGLAIYVEWAIPFPWLATILFGANFLSAGLGILTMPWVLVSEIFPLEARGLSAGLCAASTYVSYFFCTKTYFTFEQWLGMPGVFVLYGTISIAGAAYLYFFMPETEGKTLQEIELYYLKRRSTFRT